MAYLEVDGRCQGVYVASCALNDLGGIGPHESRTEARTCAIVNEHEHAILCVVADKIAANDIASDGAVYVHSEDLFPLTPSFA